MADYIVSARKYRPATFQSVVGQKALTQTLRNAIATDRVAQAYLFCGPRGVGKTSCARIFAKTLNCMNRTPDGEACGQCESCLDFQRGNSYNVVELDAASNNGVDQMRSLTEQVNIPPQTGTRRVFIIDEVHMLSQAAFNAFLKTLEEPPKYAVFILATTEKNKVLPTILSRCQIYDFARITNADIAAHLAYVAEQEHISVEPEALEIIASKADGAMRDALSIFDQVVASSCGQTLTRAHALENLNVLDHEYFFRFVERFAAADVPGTLLLYKEVRDAGFDGRFFLNGLGHHIRNLMVSVTPATATLLEVGTSVAGRFTEQAQLFRPRWYYRALQIISDCDLHYREATDKQLHIELALIKLCCLTMPAETPPMQTPPAAAPARQPVPQRQSAPTTPPATPAAPVAKSPVTYRPQGATHARTRSAVRATQQPAEQKSETPAADPPEPADVPQDAIVTPALLEEACRKFMTIHHDKLSLVNALNRAMPAKISDTELIYEILAPNPVVYQELLQEMPEFAGWLRQYLHNDTIRFTVRREIVAERQQLLTNGEFIKAIVRDNPSMARMFDTLDVMESEFS